MFQLQLFFLLHCDEWDRVVALPRHKFVTGATLLQLDIKLSVYDAFLTYCSGSSSRHFLRFLSNIFKKQSRNLCFTPLLFCMNHNDLPTK